MKYNYVYKNNKKQKKDLKNNNTKKIKNEKIKKEKIKKEKINNKSKVLTKIHKINKKENQKQKQKGGNSNINNKTNLEKFEVRTLKNFDFDKYKISNYVNANIDWSSVGGPPPEPNCCIC